MLEFVFLQIVRSSARSNTSCICPKLNKQLMRPICNPAITSARRRQISLHQVTYVFVEEQRMPTATPDHIQLMLCAILRTLPTPLFAHRALHGI